MALRRALDRPARWWRYLGHWQVNLVGWCVCIGLDDGGLEWLRGGFDVLALIPSQTPGLPLPHPQPAAEVKGKAEAKAEVKAGAKAEVKAEAKAEVKAGAKAEDKAEAKAEVKAEAKAEVKATGDEPPAKKPKN